MPRKYKKPAGSRMYANFSKETLIKAAVEVKKNNMSIREAARRCQMCPSTISRYLKTENSESKAYGGQTVLTPQEEQTLVDGLLLAAEWGMPFQKNDLRKRRIQADPGQAVTVEDLTKLTSEVSTSTPEKRTKKAQCVPTTIVKKKRNEGPASSTNATALKNDPGKKITMVKLF